MVDETNRTNTEAQAQEQHADPAATGEQTSTGKTFTQEEVNHIVSDRLARERAKTETPATPTREQELDAREAALHVRELVADGTYPAAFLDVLDTSDFDKFKAAADKLIKAFPALSPKAKIPRFTTPTGYSNTRSSSSADALRQAFGLKPKA